MIKKMTSQERREKKKDEEEVKKKYNSQMVETVERDQAYLYKGGML